MPDRPTRVRLALRNAAFALAALSRPRRRMVVVAARCPFCRAPIVLRAAETVAHAVTGDPIRCRECPGLATVKVSVRVHAHVPPLALVGMGAPPVVPELRVGASVMFPVVLEADES